MPRSFTLALPRDFDLRRAVASYGYFMLAPNQWDAGQRVLRRPLRGDGDRVIHATIAARGDRLGVHCSPTPSRQERAGLARQVRRMLRIDEDLRPWYAVQPAARRRRFGRLFRSPTLFEDIVKTITGCNVTWRQTIAMNARLCALDADGAFPTELQLAALSPATLKRRCPVGYRAQRIVRLARDVRDGRIDLEAIERDAAAGIDVYDRLRAIHGIGPYAAANICHHLGRYDRIAIDTETYRHYCTTTGVARPGPRQVRRLDDAIRAHYDRYRPYQFLAYWFELWTGYERPGGLLDGGAGGAGGAGPGRPVTAAGRSG